MSSKRKAATGAEAAPAKKARPANGIKGITVAEKSNDPLRDEILERLRKSGIAGVVESRIVFAHTGIYVASVLIGWVGPGGFAIRCANAGQKKACVDAGCTAMDEGGHKNYYTVPDGVFKNGSKLRALCEKLIVSAPPPKAKKTK